ncbi:threonine synthase [Gemmatimonadota bacterium]
MDVLRYRDTRGLDHTRPAFTDVILTGIAEGGGLFVPETLPSLPLEDILSFSALPYPARAARVLTLFQPDIPPLSIDELSLSAYADQFDDPGVAPLREAQPGLFLLELWHGPTAAFKDMALQCLPLLISEAISRRKDSGEPVDDLLILVATSGDTGSAALAGFADIPECRVAVFYPQGGISETQLRQMMALQGEHGTAVGVQGSFDDCQKMVKSIFRDEAWNQNIHECHHLHLASANSINWGRIPLQVASYVSAYADLVAMEGAGPGQKVDVCVPTGNFGNALAAWYARRIGVPIGRIICACNENDVLPDFLHSDVWDIRERDLILTPSPSMDILVSSNLERLLFEISGDAAGVRGWMDELATSSRFEADEVTMDAIRSEFTGHTVGNDESLEVIRRMHEETGYLLDPHTAVAWEIASQTRERNPMIVVSTAHWSKFGENVYRALNGIPFLDPLPSDVADLPLSALLQEVARLAPGQPIPRALSRLDLSVDLSEWLIEATPDAAEEALTIWLDQRPLS